MSLKDQILQARDTRLVPVDMEKEWGCTVYVKALTVKERLRFELDVQKAEHTALHGMVCIAMCDEQGNQVFQYPDDLHLVETKAVASVKKVFDAASKLNDLNAKDVEELEKNS